MKYFMVISGYVGMFASPVRMYERDAHRAELLEAGASEDFLVDATPGDFQMVERGWAPDVIVRLGAGFPAQQRLPPAKEEPHPHG